MVNITKYDLLRIASKEIKEICIANEKNVDCLICPLSNAKQIKDDEGDTYWNVECPFKNKPSKWNI